MPQYRAVKSNVSDDVLAIGLDEGQGGEDYHGVGVWCSFTFTEVPESESGLIVVGESIEVKP